MKSTVKMHPLVLKNKIKTTLKKVYHRYIKMRKPAEYDPERANQEQYISGGDLHPKKTFYVIRRVPGHAGFFSNFHHVLGHLKIALERGCIPLIDMQNYKTWYDEEEPIFNTRNTWEYYFEQPFPFSLEEAYQSRKIILSDGAYPYHKVPTKFGFVYDRKAVANHHQLIHKYLRLRPEVKQMVEKHFKNLLGDKSNIMGVLSRGTDMNTPFGYHHQKMPKREELLLQAEKCKADWDAEWVFLVTEEEDVLSTFKEVFKGKLIHSVTPRVSQYDGGKPINQLHFDRKNDHFLKGLEYLIDIYLLSMCDSLLCPLTNGSVAAIELNGNKYKHFRILENGISLPPDIEQL